MKHRQPTIVKLIAMLHRGSDTVEILKMIRKDMRKNRCSFEEMRVCIDVLIEDRGDFNVVEGVGVLHYDQFGKLD